ncbi:NlpC/P60 domain-containing protein OS=Streptomyces alboniger OX=132473 GN=CP975_12775 PE=3 SV=1 [Streptomyces alboniger]
MRGFAGSPSIIRTVNMRHCGRVAKLTHVQRRESSSPMSPTRTPEFQEISPESHCDCPGRIHCRRSGANAPPVRPRPGGHPAAHGARRALVLVAAWCAVLGGQALPAVAAVDAGSRQARSGPHPAGVPAKPSAPKTFRATTREAIIERASHWVAARVPYSMTRFWPDGYRQDCSGFISMAWNLPGNEWTGSLPAYGVRVTKDELKPGDILLLHNPAAPAKGSHVTLFGGWTNSARTHYTAYELARPHARRQTTPFAYWSRADRYAAYRYKGVREAPVAGSGEARP